MGNCASLIANAKEWVRQLERTNKGSKSVPSTTDMQPVRTENRAPTPASFDELRGSLDGRSTSPSNEKPKFTYNKYNRRFHNDEASIYLMPNDESEINRLQDFHYMTKWVLEGNFHPPIEGLLRSGARVLDIGCGPATWDLEMATDFPNSEFIGMDISNIYPETIKPPNSSFVEHSAVTGLPFPDNHFDFVYQRYLMGGYSNKDWLFVCSEIKRVTKPGGWVEFVEPDLTARSAGPMFQEMMSFIITAIKGKGMDGTMGAKIGSMVARCSDDPKPTLRSDFRSVPVNFGGRIGDMWANNIRNFTNALRPLMEAKWGKLRDEDFRAKIEAVLEESKVRQAYTNFHYGYVQVVKNA